MKQQKLGKSELVSSCLAYGCMDIAGGWDPAKVSAEDKQRGKRALSAALEAGYTLFDHADIYGGTACESLFGEWLKENPGVRGKIVIASKCGIRWAGDNGPRSTHRWDLSADYILKACEASLARLGIDTIDLYQLHRPDYLADPQEIARAFSQLKKQGKVREFGISNFLPPLVSAVQRACPMPLVVNQVQISLAHLDCFHDGTLDQCLEQGMSPLAWAPLSRGLLAEGGMPDEKASPRDGWLELLKVLDETAQVYGVSRGVVSLAWLRKHPSGIIPIIGTTKPERIQDAAKVSDVDLSREDWYRILIAARMKRLP